MVRQAYKGLTGDCPVSLCVSVPARNVTALCDQPVGLQRAASASVTA